MSDKKKKKSSWMKGFVITPRRTDIEIATGQFFADFRDKDNKYRMKRGK